MELAYIYKIVCCVNNKFYIGFTIQNPKERFKQHITASRKGYKGKLSAAIRKYGEENFYLEVIYCSWDIYHCKNKMERYFIEEYNSYRGGYNSTLGGNGASGRKYTIKQKKDRSVLMKELWKTPPLINRKRTSKIYTIYLKDGTRIILENLSKFCKENNLNKCNFHNILAGTQKTYQGMTIEHGC